MRVPRAVAEFNRRITNPAARVVVDWLPPLGVLEHVGRTSGRRYETPLIFFDTSDGYVVLIGYGPDSNWVRNVLASGEASIRKQGKTVRVGEPRVIGKAEAGELVMPRSRPFYRVFPYNEAALVVTRI